MYRDQFIKYLSYERRYSQHTVRAYNKDLNQFFEFLNKSDKKVDLSDVKQVERLARNWLISLIENKVSERTINRKFSALKTYFRYLMREGKIEQNPMVKIYLPKTPKRVPGFVDEEHMNLLEEDSIFDAGFTGCRDRIIIEMLYQTGIRLSELIGIRDNDIDFNKKQVKVLGKRRKERLIPVTDHLLNLAQSYLRLRNLKFPANRDSFFIVTDKGNKLYEKFVYRKVYRYLSIVTTQKKKSPHVLRHTFATHMLNDGAELNAIKELLGHANLAATQVYTHSTFEKLKKIYKQAHPRNLK